MNKFIIFLIITFFCRISFSQNNIFYDMIFKDSIKTVQLENISGNFSYPVIKLNSNEKLKLSFDDLNSENKVFDYQYTIIHCNADWTKSNLIFDDYCSGFEENNIYNYENSFNTLIDYVHFSLKIPNNDINFKLSGNYILMVYQNYNKNDTVLTKRFCVTENQTVIEGQVIVPQINSYRKTHHQISFSIKGNQFTTGSNLQYLTINVLQNNRFDKGLFNIKPDYIKENELVFNNPLKLIIPAGNEFRFFDAQNIRFESEKVSDIKLLDIYHFFLVPEEIKNKYFFHKDINGSYKINNQLGNDPDVDADYVYVHFYLRREFPFPDNDIYIIGKLSNWRLLPQNKMEYNKKHDIYQKKILLKQGYYNYIYKLEKNELNSVNGNYYETENDYVIYVYKKEINLNYDKLIGIKIISN